MMGMKWPDFRLVESKHVKVDNQPAFYAVVQYSHQTVDRKTYVKGVILQTLTPGHVWTFSCAGKGNIHTEAEQSFRYWKPTFDRILGSLVFESRFDPTNYEDTMTSKSSPAVPLGTIVKSNIDLSQSITTFSGIAVHLPSQWQEIPKDVLTANFEEFAKQNPNLPKQTYEYGFQAPSEQWFSYPYILIQIQRTGRIPEVALKEFPNLAEMFDDELQKTMEVASTVTDAAMGKTIYDSSKRILWTSMRLNYAGIGNVKMLAGGHLSEDGSVYVLGYTKEQDFSKYETLLHQIISSVELPPGMRYVPRISDNIRNSQ
jgi:hypothetical protein